MRRHAKKDICHNPISKALVRMGCGYLDLSAHGKGAPDALIVRGTEYWVFEYKAEKGRLTPDQIKWLGVNPTFYARYHIVKTLDQALRIVGLK